ncbi:MAG: hypothetical protein K2M08_07100 [Anaeroplasmataceae bacterium]|nr:hypothetical protein [Anaeroplasmataceae bacterium]MDE6242169.1 hypothetical protein [Anaeroplasmataceae bacterium]
MSYNLQKNLSHLGTILYRFSFFGLLCLIGLLISEVFVLLIQLVLVMIAFLTLFTLFFDEGFRNLFDVTASFNDVIINARSYIPLVVGISLGLLVCAFVCLLPDYKNKQTKRRLIFCVGLFVLFIILLLVGLQGGVSNA